MCIFIYYLSGRLFSYLLLQSFLHSDSRTTCHLAWFYRTKASLADMLSDGKGRGEATHWLRLVTSQRGVYLTIATTLFVPQNEEVEMELSLLLRGVTSRAMRQCLQTGGYAVTAR